MDNKRFQTLIEKQREEYSKLLPENIPVDKFIECAKTYHTDAIAKDTKGKLLAASDRSIFLSLQKAARDGLLMDGNEACFMVFGTEAQYNPMVNGIIKLLLESGVVKKISAYVVFKNEKFDLEIVNGDEVLTHRPMVFASTAEKGDRIGVYATAKLATGETQFKFLGVEKINKLKAKSQNQKLWDQEADEFWIKSALRQLNKLLLKSDKGAERATRILDEAVVGDEEHKENLNSNSNIVLTSKEEIAKEKPESDKSLFVKAVEQFDSETGEVTPEKSLEEQADEIAKEKGLDALKAWVFALPTAQKAEAMKWIQQVINKYKTAPKPEPKKDIADPNNWERPEPTSSKSKLNAIADADEIEEEQIEEGDAF